MRLAIGLIAVSVALAQTPLPSPFPVSGTTSSGSVTSVGLAGTANQITVTGTSPITSSGSWTLSFPTNVTLPGNTTGTFIGNLTGTASTATNALSLGGNLAATYAPLASPTFTGTVTIGTSVSIDGTTGIATSAKLGNAAFSLLTGAGKFSSGVPVGQAACADLSNGAASCSTDTTVATNISSGTLPAARLPAFTGDVTKVANSAATTVTALNNTSLGGLATGILKNTTATGVPSIALAADVTGLYSGSCPSGATCALATDGTKQTISAFPYAYQRGSFLGVGAVNSSAASANWIPFTEANGPVSGCGAPATSYWMHPIGGFIRNVTGTTSGTNGNTMIRFNVSPGCQGTPTHFIPNGGAVVLPGAAAGGVIDSWSADQAEWVHINQWLPLTFGFSRLGSVNTAIITHIAAEFIADTGTTETILGVSKNAALTASSTQFYGFDALLNSTELTVAIPIPIPGTLKNLAFSNTATPTNDAVLTVQVSGVASTITKTVVAADTATGNYVDSTHTAAVVEGDYVAVKAVSGAATPASIQAISLAFTPTDLTSTFIHGQIETTVTTTNKYGQPLSDVVSTTLANAEMTSPMACSISKLYVVQSVANAGGVTTTFTLMKNGATTAVTGTITSASVSAQGLTGTGAMLVYSGGGVSFAAGDRITLQFITNSGTSGTMGGWSAKCS